jgi:hypothetical protein
LHTVAGLERGGFTERFDGRDHGLPVQNSGDLVGDGGGEFAFSRRREVAENSKAQLAAYE